MSLSVIAVPLLVFALLLAPGVRLLLLAQKTGQAPERFGGLYFVGASIGISWRIGDSRLVFATTDI